MATVGKTFSDPDKWDQPWFMNLSPGKKLLFTYLWERCDHAGVIHITPALWQAHTGLQIDDDLLDSFMQEVNQDQEQIVLIGKKLWFTGYIRFNQQSDITLPLSNTYSFHKHVYKTLVQHKLIEQVQERDPVLLLNFTSSNDQLSIEELINPKPYLSLNSDLPKSTGKGAGRGRGKGEGRGRGEGEGTGTLPRISGETAMEFEMRSKGMLNDTPF